MRRSTPRRWRSGWQTSIEVPVRQPTPNNQWTSRQPRSRRARRRLWSALAERSGDESPAVVEVGGRTTSWAQLARRVDELAAGLAIAGVRPGHRVALLVPPSADLTAAVYAVWRAGAVIVVADKGLGFAGMRRALRGAAVDHVIGSDQGLIAARLMRLPGSRIAASGMRVKRRRALGAEHDLTELATLGRMTPSAVRVEVAVDDDCAVVFTSGATGPAKGVVYTHRQVLAQLELVRSTYGLTRDDRLVAAFAPFALLGPALGIGSAVPDIDVTAPGTLTASALADAAAAVDATVVFASPAALRRVAATAAALSTRQRAALGKIRLLMSAGAPVPASLLHSLREVLPGAEAHTPYGMTEVLPSPTSRRPRSMRPALAKACVSAGHCPVPRCGVESVVRIGNRRRTAGRRLPGPDRRDLRSRQTRQGPVRRAVGHRAGGVPAISAGTALVTSGIWIPRAAMDRGPPATTSSGLPTVW